ncbi:MAG: 4-(cytidine 5'-diphospho)-2-C-methyl-D-erythritol kinase [Clostridia bacterium]|nr:4-(cytidine 5'-diphospho)-2-C-methyl-D-erythritol kinase [Clostridia bacterium]
MRLKVTARAKVNWTLDVLGTLPNGYHELDMLLSSVTLSDQMEICESDSLTLSLGNAGSSFVPDDGKNLVLKAARLLQDETGIKTGAAISLQKNIPVGAGMGGGSSDAAAALLALNRLWHCGLSPDDLSRIGLRVGADVPYCLHGGLCRVQGIGEKVIPLPMARSIHLITIQPGRGLSTKEVFESLSEDGIRPEDRPRNDEAERALAEGNIRELVRSMGNVLQPVSVSKRPRLRQALQDLRDSGAIGAQMTGSGSVVYGVYSNAQKCREALVQLQMNYPNSRAMHTVDTGIEIVEAE